MIPTNIDMTKRQNYKDNKRDQLMSAVGKSGGGIN